MPGYTYQISFDWELEVDNYGDYVFKNNNIINPIVTTYTDKAELDISWADYSYSLVKNTYSMAADSKSVTFYTNYEFEVRDLYSSNLHAFSQDNTKVVPTSDLL